MGCFESRDLAGWTNASTGMGEWPWRSGGAPSSSVGLQAPELQAYDFDHNAISDRASPRDVSRTMQMNGTVNRAQRKLEVPDKYKSIEDALDAAQDGDVIRIRNGHYREHLVIQKRVHLLGVGSAQKTIIEAPAGLMWVEGSEGQPTVLLQAGEAKLSNLSFVGSPNAPAVIENMCGDLTVQGCAVRGGGAGTGIRVTDAATATIRFCDVSECRAHGIAVQRQAHCAVEKCHVFRSQCGVLVGDLGSQAALRSCCLQLNNQAGLVVHSHGSVLVDDSDVSRNAVAGIALSLHARAVLAATKVCNNRKAGVCLSEESAASLRSCDLRGNAGRPLLRSASCEQLVELDHTPLDAPDPFPAPSEKEAASGGRGGLGGGGRPVPGVGGGREGGGGEGEGARGGGAQRQSSNPPPLDASPAPSPQRPA